MVQNGDWIMISVKISISVGELCDRISILIIKKSKMTDPIKLANVTRQLEIAEQELFDFIRTNEISNEIRLELNHDLSRLIGINTKLWEIEDGIRDCERNSNFGNKFIALARGVYHTNDDRHAIKREIDNLFGPGLAEEKEYAKYEKDSFISEHL